MMATRIACDAVSKSFRRATGQKLMRHHLADLWRGQPKHDFFAVRDVTFQVSQGESVAVIGGNGAGKSTLLNLITGLMPPDAGSVQVNGRVAALLELGSGFHPDLTGAENLTLNASMLGFSRKQTRVMFDSIVDFAGIGEFIHEPLRTYSSGMGLRLAFSIAVNLDPEILIVDEVLAVGDQAFQAKCFDRIRQLRSAGKTLLFVSHSSATVLELCDRALWLDHGQLLMQGQTETVMATYQERLTAGVT